MIYSIERSGFNLDFMRSGRPMLLRHCLEEKAAMQNESPNTPAKDDEDRTDENLAVWRR